MTGRSFELVGVGKPHAAVLAVLHQGAFGRDHGWTEGDFASLMAQPGTFGWVAQMGSIQGPQPVALVVGRAVADEAEILTIGSLPSIRRQGVAGALMRAAAAEAATRGAARLFLEVATDNTAALHLYRALGFAEVGRRPGYYARAGAPAADALVMARAIA